MGAITFRYISIKTGRFNARSEQNGLYLLCRFRLNWKTKWVSILTGWNSSVNSFLRAPAVCLILRQAACRGRRPSLCGRFSLLFVRFSKTRRSIVLAAWGWVQRRGEIRSLNGAEITVAAWISSTSFKGAILIFLYRFWGLKNLPNATFSVLFQNFATRLHWQKHYIYLSEHRGFWFVDSKCLSVCGSDVWTH